jgi:hypothetical protein
MNFEAIQADLRATAKWIVASFHRGETTHDLFEAMGAECFLSNHASRDAEVALWKSDAVKAHEAIGEKEAEIEKWRADAYENALRSEKWMAEATRQAEERDKNFAALTQSRESARGLVEALKRINPEHLQKLLDDTRWMLAVTPEALRDIIERMGRLKEALAKYQTQGSGEKAEIDEIRNQYLDGVKNQKPVIFSVDKGVGKDATVTAPSPAKESALE